MKTRESLVVEGQEVKLTNLDKVLWEDVRITKADLIEYHIKMAPFTLSHYADRALTVTRYPHGIEGEFFYQKNCPDYAPEWVTRRVIEGTEFIIVDQVATLVWLANQAAIELHPSTYQAEQPVNPSYALIDLDPTAPQGFAEAVEIAFLVKNVLDRLNLRGYPKLSGATGVHVYIPLVPKYSFADTVALAQFIGATLEKVYPEKVTTERLVKNRRGVYVDHLQNGFHKTLAGVYSPRPLSSGRVSAPVTWDELTQVKPADFTIKTMPKLVLERGDLFELVLSDLQTMDHVLELVMMAREYRS